MTFFACSTAKGENNFSSEFAKFFGVSVSGFTDIYVGGMNDPFILRMPRLIISNEGKICLDEKGYISVDEIYGILRQTGQELKDHNGGIYPIEGVNDFRNLKYQSNNRITVRYYGK